MTHMTEHLMYWPVTQIPQGMWTNGIGHDPHAVEIDRLELGDRAMLAADDEAMGFGALFDLSYQKYLDELDRDEAYY
jgi:hypothetical protein